MVDAVADRHAYVEPWLEADAEVGAPLEDAATVWRAFVHGQWSAIDRIEQEGARYILVQRNPPGATADKGLTRSESEVVTLVARGYTNKVIADELGMPEGSVSAHLHRALRKLGLDSRVALVRMLGHERVRR